MKGGDDVERTPDVSGLLKDRLTACATEPDRDSGGESYSHENNEDADWVAGIANHEGHNEESPYQSQALRRPCCVRWVAVHEPIVGASDLALSVAKAAHELT
jgi:hypothetical protein